VPVNIPSKVDYTIEIEGYATGWGGYGNPEFRLYAYLTAGNRRLIIVDDNFSAYNWLRGNVAISGATSSSSYTPTVDDAGKEITVKVSGYGNTVTSTAFDVPKPDIMETKWKSVDIKDEYEDDNGDPVEYEYYYTLTFPTPYKYVRQIGYINPKPDWADDDPITGYYEFSGDLDKGSGYLYNNGSFTVEDETLKWNDREFTKQQP
jgi:hypothetical protein